MEQRDPARAYNAAGLGVRLFLLEWETDEMQPCATCDTLMAVTRIDSPGRLQAVAESLLPYVREGLLDQVEDKSPILSHVISARSLSEVAQGIWDDLVSLAFRCTNCGTRYELVAETYHGSGGAWRRVPPGGEAAL